MSFFDRVPTAATAVLVGTAIGAGIFALPFAVSQTTFLIGTLFIVGIGLITILTLLAYAEVVLRTGGIHQFPGYVQRYLGPRSRWIAVLTMVFGMYSALLAYMIEVGHFLSVLLQPVFGGSEQFYSIVFWFVCSVCIITGLQFIGKLEVAIVIGLLFAFAGFFFIGIPSIQIEYIRSTVHTSWLIPYGVILFAFGSASAIPEMRRLLIVKDRLRQMPTAIWCAMALTTLVYWSFAYFVIGISGPETTESAVVGLGGILGRPIIIIGSLFGILAMGSSFLIGGIALKQMYQYDFKLQPIMAYGLTLLIPLAIFSVGALTFVQVIEIAGVVTGGFQGILIWQMYRHARAHSNRVPEFSLHFPSLVIYLLQGVFCIGIFYQVIVVVKRFL